MFEDKTYKRCACKGTLLHKRGPKKGQPILDTDGQPKIGYLEKDCPDLKKRDHGSWYYSIELPPGPGGKRNRPKKGGFRTQTEAARAAEKVWELARGGVDVRSTETVAEYLRRWLSNRADLKRRTRKDYDDYIERVFIPALGHIKMLDLRTRPIQELFHRVWENNEVHQRNQAAAELALAAERAARTAWRECQVRPRPRELREAWNTAKAELRAARSKPRYTTGPGTQLKWLNTLSRALDDAKSEGLVAENWTKSVKIPKYVKPKPLVWTEERVARWQKTGEKPGPVMVWTAEQTGAFLDGVAQHRLYPMFHFMVFRGARRGESAGVPWHETDMTAGTVHISEQLVAASYEVWEDTPKSDSGARTIQLDTVTHQLWQFWRRRQQAEREEWEEKHRKEPKKFGPYVDSERVFTWEDGRAYHPEYLSQVFNRLIEKLGLPPIRLHDLRHCAATLSLAAGVHMKAIQKLLGHASYSLTADTYTSVLPEFERAQAEAPVALVPRQGAQQLDEQESEAVDAEVTAPGVQLVGAA